MGSLSSALFTLSHERVKSGWEWQEIQEMSRSVTFRSLERAKRVEWISTVMGREDKKSPTE